MAKEVLMPKFGQSVESSVILEWKKNEGDRVELGESICEIETDKATFEVEAGDAGTLLKILAKEGDDVPVLTPIAMIGDPGETVEVPSIETAGADAAAPPTTTTPVAEETTVSAAKPTPTPGSTIEAGAAVAIGRMRISPRARTLAGRKGVDPSQITGSGPSGRIIERDVRGYLEDRQPLTPAARTARGATGKDVPAEGTGIGGRVVAADLAPETGSAAPAAAPAAQPAEQPSTEIPVKGIRRLIAERMLHSLQSTAQLTMTASADATRMTEYRSRLKSSPEAYGLQKATINDLILCAVAKTLPEFKECNAHFLGDKIAQFEHVHLAFAVDTPRGLMVPVIRNAHRLMLREVSAEASRLRAACMQGDINPDELTGGTFTVTNLGILGIETFTPILNPPQAAILGVCAIQPKPVQKGQEVAFVPSMNLSLTINHQAVDGAPGARFLNALCEAVANIDLIVAL